MYLSDIVDVKIIACVFSPGSAIKQNIYTLSVLSISDQMYEPKCPWNGLQLRYNKTVAEWNIVVITQVKLIRQCKKQMPARQKI